MPKTYRHLSWPERSCIMLRLKGGFSFRAIARELNRSPSTITREIERHRSMLGCADLSYEAGRAGHRANLARFTRRRKHKLHPAGKLFPLVCQGLANGYSPQQIAHKWGHAHKWGQTRHN